VKICEDGLNISSLSLEKCFNHQNNAIVSTFLLKSGNTYGKCTHHKLLIIYLSLVQVKQECVI